MSAYRLITAFVCLTSLFISPQSQAATSPVGATAGQFRVSESGAATYNIPIALPPGTAGMQPALSLDYNSQGGNGLLGVGWSLGGLSAISRCPQTQAQDGVRGSVNYDGNDRFCLEGQRLIVVSGAYGADGAEYRTEIESYSRIVSYGVAGNGPAYFKVWSKSGRVMEYGVTNDSRIEAQGKSSVAVWALNKVQDTVGNYLTVTYVKDNANGQYYPIRIDYTGNAGKALATYNSVLFVYEARPDITPMYHAGSVMKSTVRLKYVQSYSGSSLVKDYRLSYDLNPSTNRSRLLNLTECAGDGTCLPATSMSYNDDPASASFTGRNFWVNSAWCGFDISAQVGVNDFNADGKSDIWCLSHQAGTMTISFSTSAGSFINDSATAYGFETSCPGYPDPYGGPPHPARTMFGDFNGDNRADLVCYNEEDGGASLLLSDIYGRLNSAPALSAGGPPFAQSGTADFNGDGVNDLFYQPTNSYYSSPDTTVVISNPASTYYGPFLNGSSSWRYGWCINSSAYVSSGDFNGDSKSDIWCRDPSSGSILVLLSNGINQFTNGSSGEVWISSWCAGSNQVDVGDFNGDGATDISCRDSASGSVRIALSDGAGKFIDSSSWRSGWCASESTLGLGDFNGDGKLDLSCTASNGNINIALSNGINAFTDGSVWYPGCIGRVLAGDFNGDGKTDIACHDPYTSYGRVAVGLAGSVASIPDEPILIFVCRGHIMPIEGDMNDRHQQESAPAQTQRAVFRRTA